MRDRPAGAHGHVLARQRLRVVERGPSGEFSVFDRPVVGGVRVPSIYVRTMTTTSVF